MPIVVLAVASVLATASTARPSVGPLPKAGTASVLGSSVLGRWIVGIERGSPKAAVKVVVVGCIHGNECAGIRVVRALEEARLPARIDLWLVPDANPDGRAALTRANGHGVDLNRNFPWHWQPSTETGNPHYSGPYPVSEPESRILYTLLETVRPELVIWYHQSLAVVDESGGDRALEALYSRLVGLPLERLPRYPGSAASWANHAFPGTTSFVVELPRGPLTPAAAHRHALAVLAVARTLTVGDQPSR
jgi:murein peptide amidase A